MTKLILRKNNLTYLSCIFILFCRDSGTGAPPFILESLLSNVLCGVLLGSRPAYLLARTNHGAELLVTEGNEVLLFNFF